MRKPVLYDNVPELVRGKTHCVRAQLGHLMAPFCFEMPQQKHPTSQECHLPGGRVPGLDRVQIPGRRTIAMGPYGAMGPWSIMDCH